LTAGASGKLIFGQDDPLNVAAGTDVVNAAARMVHLEALRPDMCGLSEASALRQRLNCRQGRSSENFGTECSWHNVRAQPGAYEGTQPGGLPTLGVEGQFSAALQT
jgi:hypothetical protein